jgi:multisubunit Na+/H+ antiporter MnhB subunit
MKTPIGRPTATGQAVDSAALAAAALAGALSVFSAPGPYVPLNAIVGLTLLIIVLAYELRRDRTNFQNVAFGAVCGLCSLLVVGFVAEFRQANWGWDYWVDLEKDPQRSNVNYWIMLTWWFGLTVVFTGLGFLFRSNSRPEPSTKSDP